MAKRRKARPGYRKVKLWQFQSRNMEDKRHDLDGVYQWPEGTTKKEVWESLLNDWFYDVEPQVDDTNDPGNFKKPNWEWFGQWMESCEMIYTLEQITVEVRHEV